MIDIYINGRKLDLFDDENILITLKMIDVEKLTNIFNDFSNSFSVPATQNNNNIFKHYYDFDIDNTFNANIAIDAYMEIDTRPFRYGKIQLERVEVKENIPSSYQITFYGGSIQLNDLFKDDTIDRLDYQTDEFGITTKQFTSLSQFDYEWNGVNFAYSLNLPTFKNGDLITPVIAYADRDWEVTGTGISNITTNTGAIPETEVRPAIRLIKIIEAIETKYGITFSRDFFHRAEFMDLFLWLNEAKENEGISWSLPAYHEVGSDPNFFASVGYSINTTDDSVTRVFDYNTLPIFFRDHPNFRRYLRYGVNVTVGTGIKYKIQVYEKGALIHEKETTGSDYVIVDGVGPFKFAVTSSSQITFTTSLTAIRGPYDRQIAGIPLPYLQSATINNTSVTTVSYMIIENNIPKMKVIDLLTGIMKMFKLVIRPISTNSFYIDTIDKFYNKGKLIDLTDYVDLTSVNIERPSIYKNILFNYKKSDNVLNKKYRETYDPIKDEVGYGDLRANYLETSSKDELKLDLPFENMMFERLKIPNSSIYMNLQIGQSIKLETDNTLKKNKSAPVLFYNNGIGDNLTYQFKFKFQSTIFTQAFLYIPASCNSDIVSQVDTSLNFGSDIDSWHLMPITNSLYNNFHRTWIDTIYSAKQRKVAYKAYLPQRYINNLELNSRIIIGNERFKINDYQINLLTGETTFNLFKDIYDYTNPILLDTTFDGKIFGSTDTITNFVKRDSLGNVYLLGSIDSYDGQATNDIIKINKYGLLDPDFSINSGTGIDLGAFPYLGSIIYDVNGNLVITGDFADYNGLANTSKLIRLLPDGTLLPGFNIGTGFNGFVSRTAFDGDKLYVVGVFTSYNGSTRNRIVKLNTDGTNDATFLNTGGATPAFNNTAYDVVVNTDGSLYVVGTFTKWFNDNQNHIIRLSSIGGRYITFDSGTGFNNTVDIRLLSNGNFSSVIVYGNFTTYKGTTSNRIVRLLSTGAIDTTFNIGTGFNGYVSDAKFMDDGRIFVTGSFTTFNGVDSAKVCILNSSGSLNRAFPAADYTNYDSFILIGSDVWAIDQTTKELVNLDLYTNTTKIYLDKDMIVFNAGWKYNNFFIYTEDNSYTIEKIDSGYGTIWIDIFNDDGFGNITIKCHEKASQTAPTVYQTRYMRLKITSGTGIVFLDIYQHGLQT